MAAAGPSGKRCPGPAGGRGQDQRGQGVTSTCPFRNRCQPTTRRRRPAPWPSGPRGWTPASRRPRSSRPIAAAGVHRLDPGARRDRGGRLQPASAPRRAGLVPGGLGFAGRGVARGLHGAERGATVGGRRSLGRCPAVAAALPGDLIAEGHTIPVARVQALHEGKRRAPPSAARLIQADEASHRSGQKPGAASLYRVRPSPSRSWSFG